jgi:MFS family permease
MFISIIGGLEGVSSIIGPVIGGVLTNTIGWRWGFWINLPFGGLLFGVLLFAFRKPIRTPGNATNATKSPLEKLKQLDFAGGFIIIGSLTCLLLALQWGGSTYPWANGRIIALFVVFVVSFILFAVWETRLGDGALFPMRLLKRKAFVASLWFGFCISSGMWIILYYVSRPHLTTHRWRNSELTATSFRYGSRRLWE